MNILLHSCSNGNGTHLALVRSPYYSLIEKKFQRQIKFQYFQSIFMGQKPSGIHNPNTEK